MACVRGISRRHPARVIIPDEAPLAHRWKCRIAVIEGGINIPFPSTRQIIAKIIATHRNIPLSRLRAKRGIRGFMHVVVGIHGGKPP